MAATENPLRGALLLVLDLQPTLLAAIPEKDTLLRRTRFCLGAARLLDLPTAFTEQVPQKLGPTAPELLEAVENPHVFAKASFSALGDEGILDAVRTLQVEHLLLCGIETPICVYQTAVSALQEGLQVTLLTDALGGRRPGDAAPCLDALVRAGAFALPSEAVFYSLLGSANHPAFKAFTHLVKHHA